MYPSKPLALNAPPKSWRVNFRANARLYGTVAYDPHTTDKLTAQYPDAAIEYLTWLRIESLNKQIGTEERLGFVQHAQELRDQMPPTPQPPYLCPLHEPLGRAPKETAPMPVSHAASLAQRYYVDAHDNLRRKDDNTLSTSPSYTVLHHRYTRSEVMRALLIPPPQSTPLPQPRKRGVQPSLPPVPGDVAQALTAKYKVFGNRLHSIVTGNPIRATYVLHKGKRYTQSQVVRGLTNLIR